MEVVATNASLSFYDPEDIVKAGSRVWKDSDEWEVRPTLTRVRNVADA